MNQTQGIEGLPSPKKTNGDKDAVDPERFQKALKVEKSDETDKREQRNRPKQQEEVEDDNEKENHAIAVPPGVFKEFMKEKGQSSSIFDPTGGSKTVLSSESNLLSNGTSASISAASNGQTSNISITGSDDPSNEDSDEDGSIDEPSPSYEEGSFSSAAYAQQTDQSSVAFFDDSISEEEISTDQEDETINAPSSNPPSSDNKESKPSFDAPPLPSPSTHSPTLLDSSDSEKDSDSKDNPNKGGVKKAPSLEKGKQAPSKPLQGEVLSKKEEKQKPQTLLKSIQEQEVTKALPSTKPSEEKKSSVEKTVSHEKLDSKTEKNPIESTDSKHDSQKDSDSHSSNKDESIITPISVPTMTLPSIPASEMSPFSSLPKDVFDLFEKMAGMLTIQKDSGKTVTTITLNMPKSVFNKAELVLEQYDTAPHSFNVQFFGSPEAIARFAKNMQGLNATIKESKLNFSINLLPPKLSKSFVSRVDKQQDREEKDSAE